MGRNKVSIRSNCWRPVIVLLLLLLPVLSIGAEKEGDIRSVRALGSADIYKGDIEGAKKEAILDAKRNAVEQVGTQVISSSVVENFILVRDKIITKADGYVHSFDILEEKQKGNIYVVRIGADVSKSALIDDATLIYNDMKKPRLMVIIPELRGKEVTPSSFAENVVNEFFVSKEFNIIDQATVRENIKKDEMRKIAEGDKLAAAKIGLRAGAEVVVVGYASLGEAKSVRNVLFSSKAAVSIKAIKTDNASLYAVSNKSEAAADGIADAAQRKAVEITSKGAAKDIFWKIVKKWNDEMMSGSDIEVVLNGVSFSSLRSVIKGFRDIDGVAEVVQRSFDSPVAVLSVTFKGDTMRLAEDIDSTKFGRFDLQIMSVSAGKMNIKFDCKAC
jgi:hypothetical protein